MRLTFFAEGMNMDAAAFFGFGRGGCAGFPGAAIGTGGPALFEGGAMGVPRDFGGIIAGRAAEIEFGGRETMGLGPGAG